MILILGASDNAWIGLVGTCVGAVIALATTFGLTFAKDLKERNDKRKLSAAIAASVFKAVLEHIKEHAVRQKLQDLIKSNPSTPGFNIDLVLPIRGSFLDKTLRS